MVQVHKTKTTESQLSKHSEHILPLGLREHTLGTGNTTQSGRRVLRSGGPNHSKSLCASRIHSPLDRALLDCPKLILHLGLGGCNPPPGCGFPHHDRSYDWLRRLWWIYELALGSRELVDRKGIHGKGIKEDKRYTKRYTGKLGSKITAATVPRQRRQKCLLVFLNVHRIIRKRTEYTVVALHPEVFRVS